MNVNAITEVQMLKKYKKSGCISPHNTAIHETISYLRILKL